MGIGALSRYASFDPYGAEWQWKITSRVICHVQLVNSATVENGQTKTQNSCILAAPMKSRHIARKYLSC